MADSYDPFITFSLLVQDITPLEMRSNERSLSPHQFSKHVKLVTLVTFEWNRVSYRLGHLSRCQVS